MLIVANTVEAFDGVDRAAFLRQYGAEPLLADIQGGSALGSPAQLCRFVLHVYPDLKRHTFKYWLASPALQLAQPATVAAVQPLATTARGEHILSASSAWLHGDAASVAWLVVMDDEGQAAQARPLSDWPTLCEQQIILAYVDPCCLPHPGWPLRNLLVLAKSLGVAGRVQVLSARMLSGRLDAVQSVLFSLDLPGDGGCGRSWLKLDSTGAPVAVGWERDLHGQLHPRVVDLRSVLDPRERAVQAVNLNLKLMRWRMFPELDVDMLATKRCLLIGAGTLGCAVARTLLGWGVHHITFLDKDNSSVAFSNPVRQSLFEFEDALNGVPKASAAADRLVRIYPNAEAAAVRLTVPMPGHSVSSDDEAAALDDVNRLDALIAEADCVFVLTDTRESRWLPTLLCAHHNKLLINAGLGFDSYLVMRHGCREAEGVRADRRLGCYFCTDVTAGVRDSTSNRSLDQQCTVTRPGLAPIAAALAVELCVSCWHHRDGPCCPADATSPLGEVPHQIRGALSRYEQRCFTGLAFSQCVACSDSVLEAYRGAQRSSFLLSVFRDGGHLEQLTGLAALHEASATGAGVIDAWDIDEED